MYRAACPEAVASAGQAHRREGCGSPPSRLCASSSTTSDQSC